MATKSAPKAVQAAPEPGEAPAAPRKGGGKKLLLILLVLVVLGAGGGGAAWFFYFRNAGDAAQAAKPKTPKPPVFVNLEPFTVNLQPESGGDQFLQMVAVLRISEDDAAEQIKVYMPELRHRMLLLLSGKRASEISTPEGREKLAEELREAVNRILGGGPASKDPKAPARPGTEGRVQSVFFTSFIVQ